MLTIENLLSVFSFGLTCVSIGFALGYALGKINRKKQ